MEHFGVPGGDCKDADPREVPPSIVAVSLLSEALCVNVTMLPILVTVALPV
jgi:hypothetical protein